ncbi:hypothetical protein V1514DRAFT_340122 [Lipomyces japonicus]|uniref:uncharacterized protein n=1 Tax=Lipomyces japonicus TaxID=56871 RepID=UPI0034CD5F91
MAPAFLRRSSSKDERKAAKKNGASIANLSQEEAFVAKQRSTDIGDPILTAVREEQPFEVSNHLGGSTVSPDMQIRDVFGNMIEEPDRSNPTRNRNERPLDTIRSFEYAATGDQYIKEQVFREKLPWEGRRYQSPIPQQYGDDGSEIGGVQSSSASASQRVPIQLGNSGSEEYASYEAVMPNKKKEKKKRGLFGRKKE